MIKEEPFKKYSKYGEVILAVVNLWLKSNQSRNINKANFSTNRQRSFRSIIEDFTAESMNMIFMQEKVTYNTFKQKMKKLENN